MKLSVIIPIYNEAFNIAEVIKRIKMVDIEKEIIIVDDGSTDGTSTVLEQYADDELIRVHSSILNFGKGTAVRIGLRYAGGDIIIIQDGDLEYDPNDYHHIIQPIIDGQANVVYGSRFKNGMKGIALKYTVGNRVLRFLANILYNANITDEATAYKAFRAEVIQSLDLKCRQFEFCPEVTAKIRKKGEKIHEVPITYDPRSVSEGKKIGWLDGLQAIWVLLKYRILD